MMTFQKMCLMRQGMRISAESRAVTEQEEVMQLTEQLRTERTQHERAITQLNVCLQSEQEVNKQPSTAMLMLQIRAALEQSVAQKDTALEKYKKQETTFTQVCNFTMLFGSHNTNALSGTAEIAAFNYIE